MGRPRRRVADSSRDPTRGRRPGAPTNPAAAPAPTTSTAWPRPSRAAVAPPRCLRVATTAARAALPVDLSARRDRPVADDASPSSGVIPPRGPRPARPRLRLRCPPPRRSRRCSPADLRAAGVRAAFRRDAGRSRCTRLGRHGPPTQPHRQRRCDHAVRATSRFRPATPARRARRPAAHRPGPGDPRADPRFAAAGWAPGSSPGSSSSSIWSSSSSWSVDPAGLDRELSAAAAYPAGDAPAHVRAR